MTYLTISTSNHKKKLQNISSFKTILSKFYSCKSLNIIVWCLMEICLTTGSDIIHTISDTSTKKTSIFSLIPFELVLSEIIYFNRIIFHRPYNLQKERNQK